MGFDWETLKTLTARDLWTLSQHTPMPIVIVDNGEAANVKVMTLWKYVCPHKGVSYVKRAFNPCKTCKIHATCRKISLKPVKILALEPADEVEVETKWN